MKRFLFICAEDFSQATGKCTAILFARINSDQAHRTPHPALSPSDGERVSVRTGEGTSCAGWCSLVIAVQFEAAAEKIFLERAEFAEGVGVIECQQVFGEVVAIREVDFLEPRREFFERRRTEARAGEREA